jgi:hypothetical protein
MGRSPSIEKLVEVLGLSRKDALYPVVHSTVCRQEPCHYGFVLTYSVDAAGRLHVVAHAIGCFDEDDIAALARWADEGQASPRGRYISDE